MTRPRTSQRSTLGAVPVSLGRATVKTGGKPRYCPPEKSSMDSNEFMARLSAVPQGDRARIDMTEATIRIMAVKFPCPSIPKSAMQAGRGGAAPVGA